MSLPGFRRYQHLSDFLYKQPSTGYFDISAVGDVKIIDYSPNDYKIHISATGGSSADHYVRKILFE